jgi:formiminotetrahydrofolate cyclodeaminase
VEDEEAYQKLLSKKKLPQVKEEEEDGETSQYLQKT